MKRLLWSMCVTLLLVGCVSDGTQNAVPPIADAEAKPEQKPSQQPSQIEGAEGYVVVPWNWTPRYVDRHAIVHGNVVAAKNMGYRCYLNFHEDYRNHFTVSINEECFTNFPGDPEKLFGGKDVVVRGFVHGETGKPEMIVCSADQITVVPPAAQDVAAFALSQYPNAHIPQDLEERTPQRVITDSIRIGTYNILNLFDEFDDPYHADEVMKPKPRAEMERVADRIRLLNADVLALQEVENRFYLEKFIRVFLPDMGYEHIVLLEGNNHRGIDVALVSRLPLGTLTSYQHVTFPGPDGKTYRFQRDLLRVQVKAPHDFTFDVFVVHLKSKYGGAEASEPVRQAEALQIRQIVDEILYQDPNAPFVICGDFNDLWESESLQIIRGSGQTELTCPGTAFPEDERVTYNRKPYRSMIDFILLSPAMSQRYQGDSYTIIPGSVEDSGSDHNPSVAAFGLH